jgi:hypothetical protein
MTGLEVPSQSWMPMKSAAKLDGISERRSKERAASKAANSSAESSVRRAMYVADPISHRQLKDDGPSAGLKLVIPAFTADCSSHGMLEDGVGQRRRPRAATGVSTRPISAQGLLEKILSTSRARRVTSDLLAGRQGRSKRHRTLFAQGHRAVWNACENHLLQAQS